jgi:transcriptional regulator with XRE-family HTH domain
MNEPRRLLGKLISRHRIAKLLSQEQLAELAGIHRTYISQIERGLKSPTLEVLIRIATALDLRTSSLLLELEELIGRLRKK